MVIGTPDAKRVRKDSDTSFQPHSSATQSSSEESIDAPPHWKERKWIVYENNLDSLFKFCPICLDPITATQKSEHGGMLSVKWDCHSSHCKGGQWKSCPNIRGIPSVNLLTSSAILFTGASETTISRWARMMNLAVLQKSQYFQHQSTYLLPAVEQLYKTQQDALLEEIRSTGQAIDVCGDGRSDSPGADYIFDYIFIEL